MLKVYYYYGLKGNSNYEPHNHMLRFESIRHIDLWKEKIKTDGLLWIKIYKVIDHNDRLLNLKEIGL